MIALRKLSPREKIFCREFVKCGNATQAMIAAGYSPKTADRKSHLMVGRSQVQAEIKRLNEKIEDNAICDVRERKIILSEVARGKASDYLFSGKDGSFISYGSDSPNQRAVAGITTKTVSGQTEEGEEAEKASSEDTIIQKLELRDAIKAIDVLNKMDGLYLQKVEVSGSEDLMAALAGFDGAAKGPPAARSK